MRLTSGSSIVFQRLGCCSNGDVPLTIARASEFSVRTWRPARSDNRSRISSWARLLNATSMIAPTGRCQRSTRCRARSVSTRVLPDPAGATIRAAPPSWVTAASWSGASAAELSFDSGGRVPPCSTATTWMTGTPAIGSWCASRPASSHIAVPSGAMMSPAPSTPARSTVVPAGVQPRDSARSSASQLGASGSRTSTELIQTKWCSVSRSNENVAPSENGSSFVINIGCRSNSASTSMTSRRRPIAATRSVSSAAPGSASTPWSMTRRSQPSQAGGTGIPGATMACLPSWSGPARAGAAPRTTDGTAVRVTEACDPTVRSSPRRTRMIGISSTCLIGIEASSPSTSSGGGSRGSDGSSGRPPSTQH